ncbi:CBO0543 family protein [Paenibacillus elgii]
MDVERNLLLLVWFVCITTIYFLVPRAKAHEFVLCFLVCQAVGWIVEVLLVQFDLVAYPLREFPKASDLNITFKVVWTPVASVYSIIFLSVRCLASWFFRDRKVFRKEANER